MTPSRPSVLARLATPVLAVGLAVGLLPATPASAATPRVANSFFGMTDNDPTSWPAAPIGSIRLWDTGTTWREIEQRRGSFDFTRLDAQVDEARRHGARVLVVLGQTPRFYAQRPNAASFYGAGASSMPSTTAWRNYVATVVHRYRGRGVDYQIWNEANVPGFWSGTPAQMAKLTELAAKAIHNNDPGAQVVSPALATRLTGQRKWLRTFYAQRSGGFPVAHWVDVVSLHLYPLPKEQPEHSMTLLAASRTMLRALHVTKPIWNTEINYGLQTGGGGTPARISAERQAAYVVRTYTLNAASGVKRMFWYSWGLQTLANTRLTFSSGTLTPAGRALTTVRSWLLGSRVQSCTRDSKGTYTCKATFSGGVRRIMWNPTRTVYVKTPPTTSFWQSSGGAVTSIRPNKTLKINFLPKMVRSAR